MKKGKGKNNAVETTAIVANTHERPHCDLVNFTVNYICTKTKQSMDINISHYIVSQHFYSVLGGQNFPKGTRVLKAKASS